MLKRHSLFERCVTLPVGTVSVARTQSFCSVGGHVHNLTTSYFERKETQFVGNKTAVYRPDRFSVGLLFVKLALLCDFSSFIRPFRYARASREHAFDASGSTKPKPQQRRQWEGASVLQKNPSPQTLRSPKIRERLVVTARSSARSCRSLSSFGRLLAASSRVLAARSEPVYFFVQTFVEFALSLPGHSVGVCLHPGPWIFFSETTNTDKTWKLVPNARLNSAIDSPHVKYVKGC